MYDFYFLSFIEQKTSLPLKYRCACARKQAKGLCLHLAGWLLLMSCPPVACEPIRAPPVCDVTTFIHLLSLSLSSVFVEICRSGFREGRHCPQLSAPLLMRHLSSSGVCAALLKPSLVPLSLSSVLCGWTFF